MANIDVQVILSSVTGLFRDNSVNVYHFTGTGNDYQGLGEHVRDAYQSVLNGKLGDVDGVQCKVYDSAGAAPNPPLFATAKVALSVQPAGPHEVALCLSTAGAPALSGRPAGLLATERSRTFIGPFGNVQMNTSRPGAALQTSLLDLGSAIKSGGPAGFLWSAGSARVEVSRLVVDNEWDTQRRRGFRPTQRSTRTI